MISELTPGTETILPLDPSMWWKPKCFYGLVPLVDNPDVYCLVNPKTQKIIIHRDPLVPPFAMFAVPTSALQSDMVPKLKELNLFAEGMAVGVKEMEGKINI